jgi:thiol-disulfide isomerase/thioredoxin
MLSAVRLNALKSNKNQGNLMNYPINQAKARKVLILAGLILAFAQIFAGESLAQNRKAAPKSVKKPGITKKARTNSVAARNLNLPKVTQIDEIALKNLLKRGDADSKPLLVNFWATWCDPCREEFPELVKINTEYAGKIDFVTVSLDDLAEIKRDVPKFLAEMKATMPAYLLKTEDEEAAIAVISKDYVGGLPFTILFDGKGASVYFIQGKFKPDILRVEIDKLNK